MNTNPERWEVEPGVTWPLTLDALAPGDWVGVSVAPYGGYVVRRGTITKLGIPVTVIRTDYPARENREYISPDDMLKIVGVQDPEGMVAYQREHGCFGEAA